VAIPVDDSVRILVVNGEPSADRFHDEVHLLATALQPQGQVFSGNSVRIIDETELATLELRKYPLVVLANVYRVSDPDVEALDVYVRSGGGLLVFLGDQVDPGQYNDSLYADGEGLLPLMLSEVVQAPAGGVSMAEGDYLHPVVRVFAGQDNPFVKRILFERYFGIENEESGRTADQGASQFSIVNSEFANVVARFGDGDRSPAIVEKRHGAGRVMLVTTSCDLEWNNWAKDPSYVVAVLEIVRYLARGSDRPAELLVGTPIEMELDPGRYKSQAVLRTPGYPAEREIALTATAQDDGGGLVLRWERTERAGLYRVLLRRSDGQEEQQVVAVNLDPREGDLTAATQEDLRRALPDVPFEYVTSVEQIEDLDETGRQELWPAFLIAALAVLIGEQGLAFWFGKRVGH
jgi:hypothetical protein